MPVAPNHSVPVCLWKQYDIWWTPVFLWVWNFSNHGWLFAQLLYTYVSSPLYAPWILRLKLATQDRNTYADLETCIWFPPDSSFFFPVWICSFQCNKIYSKISHKHFNIIKHNFENNCFQSCETFQQIAELMVGQRTLLKTMSI